VLITESTEDFERLCDSVKDELKPQGILEGYYVREIAEKAWEIRRLRRVKTNFINAARRQGVRRLLSSLIECWRELDSSQRSSEIYRLTEQWFGDEGDKREVLEILKRFRLDEFAIEATTMLSAAEDLDKIDRLLVSLESRLNKALRSLAELRGGFGRQLRANAEKIIEGEILPLDSPSKNPPAAA